MKLAFAATNPCHLWDLASALASLGPAVDYYSGYPAWRLPGAKQSGSALKIHCASARTLATYGILRLPQGLRPPQRALFRWQDEGFDRAIAARLKPADFIHGIPGQCLAIFTKAKRLGITTVLNHASGPRVQQELLMKQEYARAGFTQPPRSALADARTADRERSEYELADLHCAASSIVREQLIASGIPASRIMVAPYGANPLRFPKRSAAPDAGKLRIVFAGGLSLRKGIHYLLRALELAGTSAMECHFIGPAYAETEADFRAYHGPVAIIRHGALSQQHLAEELQQASLLVLPSVEDAFGLVVVQALQCGVPCVVSDRVGAKDLIRPRENGSIFPFGEVAALAGEIAWWAERPRTVAETYDWQEPARIFLAAHRQFPETASAA